jgi:cytochrome c
VLMAASDCRACHTVDAKSVGPALVEIAQRYRDQPDAKAMLAHKIIAGGGGNWGNQFVMAAHPQIPFEDAEEIVGYILSLGKELEGRAPARPEPLGGELALDRHQPSELLGRYLLTAGYTDDAHGEIPGQRASAEISLRSATVPAEYVDAYSGFNRWGPKLAWGKHKAHLYLRDIDLTAIAGFTFTYQAPAAGEIEVRQFSANGPVIARVTFPATKEDSTVTAKLAAPLAGRRDLYFIMRQPVPPNENVITVKSIRFERE